MPDQHGSDALQPVLVDELYPFGTRIVLCRILGIITGDEVSLQSAMAPRRPCPS